MLPTSSDVGCSNLEDSDPKLSKLDGGEGGTAWPSAPDAAASILVSPSLRSLLRIDRESSSHSCKLVSQRADQLDAKLADSQPHVVVNIAMVVLVLATFAPFGFLLNIVQALHVVVPVSLREPTDLQHL